MRKDDVGQLATVLKILQLMQPNLEVQDANAVALVGCRRFFSIPNPGPCGASIQFN